MARTIAEIQAGILANIAGNPTLSALNSTSSTALYRLFAFVVAVAAATLENIYDVYRVDLREQLASQGPHTLRYYQEKALNFQLGDDLTPGTTVYPAVDEDARVVAYAAVREAGNTLQVKAAKESIEPLSAEELTAFTDYMQDIKDAGVRLDVSSDPADRLRATIDVYYNPQVLDNSGRRLDGSNDTVIESAVRAYTESLRFDGQFVQAGLVDELQRTEGVELPAIRSLQIAPAGNPAFVPAGTIYFPVSGFVRLYAAEDLTINYIPYGDS